MGDKSRGIYNKFIVERTDGTSAPGGKHHGCKYFVLDIDHDPHAMAALAAYADSCEEEYPLLAKDIRAKYSPALKAAPSAPAARGWAIKDESGKIIVVRMNPAEEGDLKFDHCTQVKVTITEDGR